MAFVAAAAAVAVTAVPAGADFSAPQVLDPAGGIVTALQADPRGDVLVASAAGASGSTSTRPRLRLRVPGARFGPAIRTPASAQYAFESGGRVLRAWIAGTPRAPRIAVATLRGGRQIGPTQLLQPPGRQGFIEDFALAGGPGGRAVVIWSSGRTDLSSQRLLAAFRASGARAFAATRAVTGPAPFVERLHVAYDGPRAVASWEQRLRAGGAASKVAYARQTGSRFGAVGTLVPRLAPGGELLRLISTDAGVVAVWQSSRLFVQPLRSGARRDSVDAPPALGSEEIDAAGPALIAVWTMPASSMPNACDAADIEAVSWNSDHGFGTPREIGPAGGHVSGNPHTLTVALAPSGRAVIAWDVAPGHFDDPVFGCVPSDDVIRAVTLQTPDGTPTAPVTLSPVAPRPEPCRSCAGQGEWGVWAAASDAVRVVAWQRYQVGASFLSP
jgi:hypothetical protein